LVYLVAHASSFTESIAKLGQEVISKEEEKERERERLEKRKEEMKEREERTVFLGNLSVHENEKNFKKFAQQFGKVRCIFLLFSFFLSLFLSLSLFLILTSLFS
jgi:hypothetical protein